MEFKEFKYKGDIYEWRPRELKAGSFNGGVFIFLVLGEDDLFVKILPLLNTTTYNLNDVRQFSKNSEIDFYCKRLA
jgi:hypothetical protein